MAHLQDSGIPKMCIHCCDMDIAQMLCPSLNVYGISSWLFPPGLSRTRFLATSTMPRTAVSLNLPKSDADYATPWPSRSGGH